MKKISILLTASAFMFLSFSVSAADIVASGTNCGSNCSWTLDSDGNVNITSTGENLMANVNSSPWASNEYKGQVKTITTSDSVTGDVGCQYCSALETVTYGKNVSGTGWTGFQNSSNLKTVNIPQDSQLTSLGAYAFTGTKIEDIYIPSTIQTIGSEAFNGTNIKKLVIPDGVTVDSLNCVGCKELTEVVIGNNVKSVGWYGFQNSSKLEKVTFSEDSHLTSLGAYAFTGTSIESIDIPASVTSIGSEAFNNTKLKKLVIPDTANVSSLNCSDCTELTELVIGGNVTGIGWYGFQRTKIDSLVIPDTVTSIGLVAFNAVSLSSITCNAENLQRYIDAMGQFKADASISCTRGNCEDVIKGTKWEGKVSVTYPTEVKPLANGGVAIFKNGEFVGYKGKRIYTVEEANAVTGITNKVAIRYK